MPTNTPSAPVTPPLGVSSRLQSQASYPNDEKIQVDLNQVRDFQKQVIDLLQKFQKNRLIDAESKQHQQQLEAIIRQTNYILKQQKTTPRDNKNLEALLEASNNSFREMKQNNANNAQFRKEFVKQFGTNQTSGTINHQMAQNLATSLSQFTQALKVSSQPAVRQGSHAVLQSILGPFGFMAADLINTSALKSYAGSEASKAKQWWHNRSNRNQRMFQNTNEQLPSPQTIGPILGAYATGTDLVPKTGTYILHQDERVVPAQENTDLTRFLEAQNRMSADNGISTHSPLPVEIVSEGNTGDQKQRLLRVFNMGHAQDYFEPLIDTEEAIDENNRMDDKKYREEMLKAMEILNENVDHADSEFESLGTKFVSLTLEWRKFMRHPVWNILGVFLSAALLPIKGIWHLLFGKKKDKTEEIIDSIKGVKDAILRGRVESEETPFKRFFTNMINFGGLTRAQRISENRAQYGRRRGIRGLMDSLNLIGYHKYLDEVEVNPELRASRSLEPAVANPELYRAERALQIGLHTRTGRRYQAENAAVNAQVAERMRREEFNETHGPDEQIPSSLDRTAPGGAAFMGAKSHTFMDLLTTQHKALFYIHGIASKMGVARGNTMHPFASFDASTRAHLMDRDSSGRFLKGGHKKQYTEYEVFVKMEKLLNTQVHEAKEGEKTRKKVAKETKKVAEHTSIFMRLLMGAGRLAGSLLGGLLGKIGGLAKTFGVIAGGWLLSKLGKLRKFLPSWGRRGARAVEDAEAAEGAEGAEGAEAAEAVGGTEAAAGGVEAASGLTMAGAATAGIAVAGAGAIGWIIGKVVEHFLRDNRIWQSIWDFIYHHIPFLNHGAGVNSKVPQGMKIVKESNSERSQLRAIVTHQKEMQAEEKRHQNTMVNSDLKKEAIAHSKKVYDSIKGIIAKDVTTKNVAQLKTLGTFEKRQLEEKLKDAKNSKEAQHYEKLIKALDKSTTAYVKNQTQKAGAALGTDIADAALALSVYN